MVKCSSDGMHMVLTDVLRKRSTHATNCMPQQKFIKLHQTRLAYSCPGLVRLWPLWSQLSVLGCMKWNTTWFAVVAHPPQRCFPDCYGNVRVSVASNQFSSTRHFHLQDCPSLLHVKITDGFMETLKQLSWRKPLSKPKPHPILICSCKHDLKLTAFMNCTAATWSADQIIAWMSNTTGMYGPTA